MPRQLDSQGGTFYDAPHGTHSLSACDGSFTLCTECFIAEDDPRIERPCSRQGPIKDDEEQALQDARDVRDAERYEE